MSTVCIIPARGGSTRIPGKNIKSFYGEPIIARAINIALETDIFDEVVVSTDDMTIAEVARNYGAQVLMRDSYLAENHIGTQEVMKNVCVELMLHNDDKVCCLYATCPLLNSVQIVEGLAWMKMQPYVYTTDHNLKDIGGFYWGHAWAFKGGLPLEGYSTILSLEDKYCCDINTPEDWERAVVMHKELYGD